MMQSVLGTQLHYEDDGWQEIDMRAQRVNNAQLDGWIINKNGWHYALGIPGDKSTDGWVGFGGRKGAHWVKFRLRQAGYLHWPTRAWQDIGGPVSYGRAYLSQSDQELPLGAEGEQQPLYAMSTASWSNLWSTPGGGDVTVRWIAEGERLKEEVVLNQTAREWIAANAAPATAINETYFGFVFELDVADVPKWVINDIEQDIDGDFDDTGGNIELRDDVDELLAFMPLDYVYVDTDDGRVGIRLQKRIFQVGGEHYLLIGARVDRLAQLPAGALVFDPTFESQPAPAAGKDTWTNKPTPSVNYETSTELYLNASSAYDRKIFVEFDCSSIPAGSVASSVDLDLTVGNQALDAGETIYAYSLHSNVAEWTEGGLTYDDYTSLTSWPGSAGCNTADTDYESGALGSGSGPVSKNSAVTVSLSTTRIDGWYGASNTNYGLVLEMGGSSGFASFYSSDYGTASYRPKLSITYEVPINEAIGVGATVDPTVVLNSTTATPDAATGVGYTSGPDVLQGSVPPTLLSYSGNIFLSSKGDEMSVLFLATEGDYWRLLDVSNTIETIGVTFDRYVGYLVPQ